MRASRYTAAALVAAIISAPSLIAGAAELTIRGASSSDIRDRFEDGLDARGSQTSTVRTADTVRGGISGVRAIPEGDLALLGCKVFVAGGPKVAFLQVADGAGLLGLPELVGESCADVLNELIADNLDIDETKTVTRSAAGVTSDILIWVLIRP